MLIVSYVSLFAGGGFMTSAFLRAYKRAREGASPIDLAVVVMCGIAIAALLAPIPLMSWWVTRS
jgi:hypothetical protein